MAIIDRAYSYQECNADWKPTWIVEPFLMHEGVTIIHAEPKARKSTFRAHLIAACMAGLPVCGFWPITKKIESALVVIGEENRHAEATRIADAVRALGLDPTAELSAPPIEDPLGDGEPIANTRLRIVPPISGVWLDDEGYVELVAQEIAEYEIDLVVLDPLTGFHRGVENDADAMARVCAGIRRLAQDASVLVIHHDSKLDPQHKRKSGDRMRGSSVLRGAYDMGIEIREAGPDCRELHFETRYSPPLEPQLIRVRYDLRATHWQYLGEKDLTVELREYLRNQGGGWVTEARIQLEVTHPPAKIRRTLDLMTMQGELAYKNDGGPSRWKMVTLGA